MLPEELWDMVCRRCDVPTRLVLSEVNPGFLRITDAIIQQEYETELCTMLRAMRVSPRRIPRTWLYRYAQDFLVNDPCLFCARCGGHIHGLLTCHCHECHTPTIQRQLRFPWEKALVGPLTAVCILSFLRWKIG